MLFYIFWGFTALMLLVLIVVMLFTLIKGNAQKRSWKKILKMLFKGVGIVVVTYIVLFYVGGYMFMSSYKKECGPNPKEVEVMKPQAEVVTNYILKYGIPKSMTDIPNLPYKLQNCERETFYAKNHPNYTEGQSEEATDDEVLKEKCTFIVNDRTYEVSIRFSVAYKQQYINTIKDDNSSLDIFNSEMLEVGGGDLDLYNKKTETGMSYNYELDGKNSKWIYYNNPFMDDEKEKKTHNPQIYSTKNDGICNPMRM